MGGSRSKIPDPTPGNILLLTGIDYFDNIYKKLESPVKKIMEAEIDMNMTTNDFIKSLGAEEV